MPVFTRYFIKTSIIYFMLGLGLGILIELSPFLDLPVYLTSLMPTYLHVFVVGWVTQMIFGVSIWMFPSPENGGRYGNMVIIWSIYTTINIGLLLRIIAEPAQSIIVGSGILLVFSALLQWLSGVLYTYHIWNRAQGK